MAYTTIDNPELYFQCKIYTGNGSATHAITFDGDEDMQPDLVWIKNRSSAENHAVVDAVRGVGKQLLSNSTAGEYSNANSVKAFNSDGFSVGDLSDTPAKYVSPAVIAFAPVPVEPDVGSPEFCQVPFFPT